MKNREDLPKSVTFKLRKNKGSLMYYVHYVDYNKRLDEWVPEDRLDTRKIEPPQGKEERNTISTAVTGVTTTGLSTPKKVVAATPASTTNSRPTSPTPSLSESTDAGTMLPTTPLSIT